jgi:hypothetical protein
MASDSSPTTTIPSSFSIPITEKLSKANYHLWRAQILPPIHAAQLEDVLTGVEMIPTKTIKVKSGDSVVEQTNPDYVHWSTRDQALLRYIFSSLMREVLMSVTTHSTSAEVWNALEGMYGSHTRAQTVNTRIALATTKKGTSTMAEFYSKMKNLANEMASSGHRLSDEEFVPMFSLASMKRSTIPSCRPSSHGSSPSRRLNCTHRC